MLRDNSPFQTNYFVCVFQQHWRCDWQVSFESKCWRVHYNQHYSDVIMGPIVSQITSLTTVYRTLYSDQRKHQRLASLAFVQGIHRSLAQRASNAENVSIRWRHHEPIWLLRCLYLIREQIQWRFFANEFESDSLSILLQLYILSELPKFHNQCNYRVPSGITVKRLL